MLKGKKILLCISGSIAAYKAVILLRLLVKSDVEVKIIMTPSATDFVAPLTFSTLSGSKVLIDFVYDDVWVNHVLLGRWADAIVIAPATCNTLAKMANGQCDNLLLSVYLSATCPVIIAPAMDEDMWYHAATQRNLDLLQSIGNYIIPVNTGELASGLSGTGRMAEPEEIIQCLESHFESRNSLKNIHALVTAGPTYEALDPVRFIGNHSTGKMGIAIAEELSNRGARVTLVLGPTAEKFSNKINTISVISAEEMYLACMQHFDEYKIIIMAAAVADYRPSTVADQKIKKDGDSMTLELIKTKDILLDAGKRKSGMQVLVGFALETQNEKENAQNKLVKKNADYIIMNSLNDDGAGFGKATNKITIFEKGGKQYDFPLKSKKEVATDIINVITQHIND
ncbi:MAG: bifunctional phosphopantothenoylcysteine decarboxylase/phosphopantothenate--cysteine ligase CoaBC [Ginsengibacter sp.]|jgi:phosphopantothenoylcysteine decarboxylase/phosphopantothenate--cysteine ligase